ncbi:hypothetical protein AAFF_G00016830 [Aldrovandia affinis]|uniref:Uncharacterized protein n=1 Tax=Aldrovandia affinis TaxID=143900 RepID=A0AAD7S5Y1_9TELE|nr:hypothetical protein AAFF_G00016830 [Aldrovandia affinis]
MQTMGLIHTLEQCLNRMQTVGLIHTLELYLNRMQTVGLIHTLEQCLNRMTCLRCLRTPAWSLPSVSVTRSNRPYQLAAPPAVSERRFLRTGGTYSKGPVSLLMKSRTSLGSIGTCGVAEEALKPGTRDSRPQHGNLS